MSVCIVLVELAITCVYYNMGVTVKVLEIFGKMNLKRWALAIAAVPSTLTSELTNLPLIFE